MKPLNCVPALLLLLSACAAQDEPASAGLLEPESTAVGHEPFERACARLHGECASVCSSPFLECYLDAPTCAEQWEADFLGDFEEPLVDEQRMRRCAAQVDEQSCTNIEPDTLECEFAIVESCVGDRDSLGQPYSPFLATPVETDVEIQLEVCPSVDEFVSVELERGMVLDIQEPEDAPNTYFRLSQLLQDSAGDAVQYEYALDQPVPEDGVYIVEVSTSDRALLRLRFAPRFAGESE